MAQAVIEFNRDLLGIQPRPISPLSSDEFSHLSKAFSEEFGTEFREAFDQEDVIKMVDSIIDGMYFAIGGLYKMGLDADQIEACFLAVHNANMSKVAGKVARRAVGNVPDAIKPENWISPELEIAKILDLSE